MRLLLGAALLGYLVGSVSPATLLAQRRGIDLRDVGSGNPGATNAARVLGARAGVLVAVADVLKGLVPAVVMGLLSHDAGLVAGVAAVLGHVSSPLLRGRGGKGVATAAGAVLGSQPLWGGVLLLVWVLTLLATRTVALASVLAAVALPVVALLVGEDRLWAAALALVVVVRHRGNLTRVRPR